MTDQAIDWTKPIEYVDGRGDVRPARVLCTDKRGGEAPVVALVVTAIGDGSVERTCFFDRKGHEWARPTRAHLRNVRTKHTGWTNVYKGKVGTLDHPNVTGYHTEGIWRTREDALRACDGGGAIDTVPIEWSEPA